MNRKVMRKSTLISSIAMLLVAVLALSGVTFAWFTTETTAQTDAIEMKATAASGLYVAGTTTKPASSDWSGTLNWGNEGTFKPVSAAFYKNETVDCLTDPAFYTTYTDKADGAWAGAEVKQVAAKDGGENYYVVKHIWVASDSTENVKLTMELDVTAENFMGYERMAIVDLTDPTAPVLVHNGEGNDGKLISFEGNDSAEAIISATVTNNALSTMTMDAARFTGVKTFDAGEVSKDNPKHFVVYFWFEGQDAECRNENSGAEIGCNIIFGLAENG